MDIRTAFVLDQLYFLEHSFGACHNISRITEETLTFDKWIAVARVAEGGTRLNAELNPVMKDDDPALN